METPESRQLQSVSGQGKLRLDATPCGSLRRVLRVGLTRTWIVRALTIDLRLRPTPRLELNICWAEFADISRNLPGGRASKLE